MLTEKQKLVIERYRQKQKHSSLLEIIQSLLDWNKELELTIKTISSELKQEKILRWSAEHSNRTKVTNQYPEIDLGEDEL